MFKYPVSLSTSSFCIQIKVIQIGSVNFCVIWEPETHRIDVRTEKDQSGIFPTEPDPEHSQPIHLKQQTQFNSKPGRTGIQTFSNNVQGNWLIQLKIWKLLMNLMQAIRRLTKFIRHKNTSERQNCTKKHFSNMIPLPNPCQKRSFRMRASTLERFLKFQLLPASSVDTWHSNSTC